MLTAIFFLFIILCNLGFFPEQPSIPEAPAEHVLIFPDGSIVNTADIMSEEEAFIFTPPGDEGLLV